MMSGTPEYRILPECIDRILVGYIGSAIFYFWILNSQIHYECQEPLKKGSKRFIEVFIRILICHFLLVFIFRSDA